MVELGLLACSPSFADPSCSIKLVQCLISLIMLVLVIYGLARRQCLEFRISFYLFVSLFMALTLTFLIVYYLDSDRQILSYIAAYCYDVYFSIIVLKVGLKLIQILRNKIKYQTYRKTIIATFITYQLLLLGALIYQSIDSTKQCSATPFLIANAISVFAAILFVLLGVKHNREQQRRIDQSLADGMQNNPLPQFRCWIITNFVGQVLVLTQSIIFEVNQCKFSQDPATNEIFFAVFAFLSFHLGIASTIYFFYRSESTEEKNRRNRNSTLGISNPREIEMVYVDHEKIRQKMVSL